MVDIKNVVLQDLLHQKYLNLKIMIKKLMYLVWELYITFLYLEKCLLKVKIKKKY